MINLGRGKNLRACAVNMFSFAIIMAASCELKCIIHYNIKDAKYSKVQNIPEINKQRILETKNLRIAKAGPKYHKEQYD